jgi:hypothetical protein
MFSCFLFSACYGVYQKEGKKKNFPLYALIFEILFPFEKREKSSMKMWNHRVRHIFESTPAYLAVDFSLKVLWHTFPRLHEVECMLAHSLDILCTDMCGRDDILFLDFDPDFFLHFSYSSRERTLISLDLSTRKTPKKRPVFCIPSSFYEEKV